MPIQKPKGTEDFYPEDEAVKQALFSQFRNVAQSFGFQEVSSPAFENFELLSQKEGEEIKQQIFTLEKRGDENFGLRFDLTIPNTRLFMQKQQELQKTKTNQNQKLIYLNILLKELFYYQLNKYL